MSVKLVNKHSRNRLARSEMGIECSRTQIRGNDHALIWLRNDGNSNNKEYALSSAFDWEICPDDNGWITLRAYRQIPENV